MELLKGETLFIMHNWQISNVFDDVSCAKATSARFWGTVLLKLALRLALLG